MKLDKNYNYTHEFLRFLAKLKIVKWVNRTEFRHSQFFSFLDTTEGKIADIGCGNGKFAKEYLNLDNVFGCDILEESLIKNYTVHNVIDKLPYEDDEFDIVLCQEVIEHVPNALGLLKELTRICKDNGTIYLTFPNCANVFERYFYLKSGNSSRYHPEKWGPYGHINYITSAILEYYLSGCNLEIEKIGSDGCILYEHKLPLPNNKSFSYTLFYKLAKKQE